MSLSPREPDAEEIERKWTAIWESRVKELPLLPDPRPRALTPDPFESSDTASKQAPRPFYQESASWFKVPPNIRRDILRLAFGDARLHMCMEYGYPDVPREAESTYHCNIVVGPGENSKEEFRLVNKSQSTSWHWWGSRCHRYFPISTREMGPMTRKGSKGPWEDYCRDGGNHRRLKSITSLEITWPFDTKFTPEQSYDNLDQDHIESVLGLLSSDWFTSLRRLYVFFDEGEAWLALSGSEAYSKVIFDHMDAFARRMTHLSELEVEEEGQGGIKMYELNKSYQQVWRDIHGNVTAVQLPYVDSYPKAPYHLPQGDNQVPGYWILEVDTDKIPHTPPPYTRFCGHLAFDHPDRLGSGSSPRSDILGYSPESPSYIPVSPQGSPKSPTSPDRPDFHELNH
ncbi:hypothetical protein FANTH_11680 [Fusarium anthophilum]|uniref:Uncharacterized protein n=1 Tax=Fusarium anthophilum TaxID=48485 RepID=A0A8H4YWD8_9HYPO|nr:hypothetical protein FANTH_11680 [Fusarium anthophilum]